jgi:hypothetical protein
MSCQLQTLTGLLKFWRHWQFSFAEEIPVTENMLQKNLAHFTHDETANTFRTARIRQASVVVWLWPLLF